MRTFLACLVLMLAASLHGQTREANTGFLDRTVTVDGFSYKFQVYLPLSWTKQQRLPVILFLHGAGERGGDGLLQTAVGLPQSIRLRPKRWPFIVVIPQASEGSWWTLPAMQAQALAALEQSITEFNGDRRRVYLTGLSMGGYGAWDLAAKGTPRFAAYAPICGGVRPPPIPGTPRPAVDPKLPAEAAKKIGKAPVWAFHGEEDNVVPPAESRQLVEALRAAGGNVRYTEYPGVGHNSWDLAYAVEELPRWMLQFSLAEDFRYRP